MSAAPFVRLVKVAPAVKSFALYNRGAKPSQWDIVSADGAVLYRARGKRDGHARPTYSLYEQGTEHPVASCLSFQTVREFAAKLATGSAA
jgi:hypothetical protein